LPGDETGDLLDLALAEEGRRPIWLTGATTASVTVRSMARARPAASSIRLHNREQTNRLRIAVAAAHAQIGADDDHPPGFSASSRPYRSRPFTIEGFQSVHSQPEHPRASNNWIGAPGMMVEIACL